MAKNALADNLPYHNNRSLGDQSTMRMPSGKRLLIVAFSVGVCAMGCDQLGIRIGKPNLPQQKPLDQGIRLSPVKKEPEVVNEAISASESDKDPDLTIPILPYTEWTIAETAADSIGRIGKDSVPVLVEALEQENPFLRRQAAAILGRIGPDAEDAVPALIVRLHDPDETVRKEAARALGQIGPKAGIAVPALMRVLEESSGEG